MSRSTMLAALLFLTAGCTTLDFGNLTGERQASLLQQTGAPAWATVLRIWDTGITINDDPVVGMEVEVRPESGGAPFRAVIPRSRISRLDIPRIQPGQTVAVRYDSRDPSQAALDEPAFPPFRPSGQDS